METFLNIIINGLLLGGLYSLIAMGLSLQYGVARILNVSHGEFIMVGALSTWFLYTAFDINPLIVVTICGPIVFIVGYILHRTMFKYLLSTSPNTGIFESRSLLASFGLLFIIQNLAIIAWGGSEIRSYSYLVTSINIGGAMIETRRLVLFAFAIAIGVGFYIFLAKTRLGKAIRAAAQDPTTAGLMGVNVNSVLAICFGFGAAMAGIAGVLFSLIFPVHPAIGLPYTIIAIIIVVLGGLGNIPGAFIGGLILGIVGRAVTQVDANLALVAYYAIFILLLILRPRGIMGK